ncbi:hypothetical protein Tco_0888300 [Tanacetum coccineum]
MADGAWTSPTSTKHVHKNAIHYRDRLESGILSGYTFKYSYPKSADKSLPLFIKLKRRLFRGDKTGRLPYGPTEADRSFSRSSSSLIAALPTIVAPRPGEVLDYCTYLATHGEISSVAMLTDRDSVQTPVILSKDDRKVERPCWGSITAIIVMLRSEKAQIIGGFFIHRKPGKRYCPPPSEVNLQNHGFIHGWDFMRGRVGRRPYPYQPGRNGISTQCVLNHSPTRTNEAEYEAPTCGTYALQLEWCVRNLEANDGLPFTIRQHALRDHVLWVAESLRSGYYWPHAPATSAQTMIRKWPFPQVGVSTSLGPSRCSGRIEIPYVAIDSSQIGIEAIIGRHNPQGIIRRESRGKDTGKLRGPKWERDPTEVTKLLGKGASQDARHAMGVRIRVAPQVEYLQTLDVGVQFGAHATMIVKPAHYGARLQSRSRNFLILDMVLAELWSGLPHESFNGLPFSRANGFQMSRVTGKRIGTLLLRTQSDLESNQAGPQRPSGMPRLRLNRYYHTNGVDLVTLQRAIEESLSVSSPP